MHKTLITFIGLKLQAIRYVHMGWKSDRRLPLFEMYAWRARVCRSLKTKKEMYFKIMFREQESSGKIKKENYTQKQIIKFVQASNLEKLK